MHKCGTNGCTKEFKTVRGLTNHYLAKHADTGGDGAGAAAEVTSANPAGLVGHDELGLGSSLQGFLAPATAKQADTLKRMAGFGGYQIEEGAFARLTEDDFIVAVHFTPTDTVALIWMAEEGEPRTFVNDEGQEITFREKRCVQYKPLGKGERYVEEAQAQIAEITEGVLLQSARALEGFGDAGEALQAELDEPDAITEIEALMGAESVAE